MNIRKCGRQGRGYAALTGWLSLALVVMSPHASAADMFNGKEVYHRHCSGCHGTTGEGVMPGMPNFVLGDRMAATDRALADSIRQGNGVMPGFGGMLTDEEILDVITYLRTLL